MHVAHERRNRKESRKERKTTNTQSIKICSHLRDEVNQSLHVTPSRISSEL